MVTFGTHRAPDRFEVEKKAHFERLVMESIRVGGEPTLRTWTGGQQWMRRGLRDGVMYDYRAMLPNQITFDIGDDDEDGTARPWGLTRRDTHLAMDALNWLGQPYWCSPTDGKGFHIEVFLESVPEEGRREVARSIVAMCNAALGAEVAMLEPFVADPRLFDPRDGARQIREFGAKKDAHTTHGKALWHIGPGPYEPIPMTKEATYERLVARIASGEALAMPKSIPRGESVVGLATFQSFARATGGKCPQGLDCYGGPHRASEDWPSFCEVCPLGQ